MRKIPILNKLINKTARVGRALLLSPNPSEKDLKGSQSHSASSCLWPLWSHTLVLPLVFIDSFQIWPPLLAFPRLSHESLWFLLRNCMGEGLLIISWPQEVKIFFHSKVAKSVLIFILLGFSLILVLSSLRTVESVRWGHIQESAL